MACAADDVLRLASLAQDYAAATRIIFFRSFGSRKYGFVSLSGFSLPFIVIPHVELYYKL